MPPIESYRIQGAATGRRPLHATSAQFPEAQNWHSYAIEMRRLIFYNFFAGPAQGIPV